jgi:hypothetical protein
MTEEPKIVAVYWGGQKTLSNRVGMVKITYDPTPMVTTKVDTDAIRRGAIIGGAIGGGIGAAVGSGG